MPWLFAAALLHSAIVVEKRESLKSWTILLAILAFGFSLIGTFIVRSGVLTSVHAFANDPERGVYILGILVFFMGGALMLFAARASAMEAKGVFGLVSRESALVLNNVLLAVSSFVVFVGTIWPLLAEMFLDRKLSVGAPFFNMAFTPFMVALGLLLPLGAMIPWKRAALGGYAARLKWPLILSVVIAGLVWAIQTEKSLGGPIGIFLGAWIVSGALVDLLMKTGRQVSFSRLWRVPRADWGKSVAHAGLGITMFAIAGLMSWEAEDIRVVQIGESWNVEDVTLKLEAVERKNGPNYITTMATVAINVGDKQLPTLYPEKRNYVIAQMPTTEAAIDYQIFRDIYVVIGDPQADGGWAVRTYLKPFANWIWAGVLIMAFGGVLSLTDRRYRVAVGATKRRSMPQTGVAAE
jgi:cytochrome c-type biogenesis protein CcmF